MNPSTEKSEGLPLNEELIGLSPLTDFFLRSDLGNCARRIRGFRVPYHAGKARFCALFRMPPFYQSSKRVENRSKLLQIPTFFPHCRVWAKAHPAYVLRPRTSSINCQLAKTPVFMPVSNGHYCEIWIKRQNITEVRNKTPSKPSPLDWKLSWMIVTGASIRGSLTRCFCRITS